VKKHIGELRKIITDKLRGHDVAHREIIPESMHDNAQYANNKAELSHQPTMARERGCESLSQWNRHSDSCRFNLVRTETYRFLRMRFFACWENAAMT